MIYMQIRKADYDADFATGQLEDLMNHLTPKYYAAKHVETATKVLRRFANSIYATQTAV